MVPDGVQPYSSTYTETLFVFLILIHNPVALPVFLRPLNSTCRSTTNSMQSHHLFLTRDT